MPANHPQFLQEGLSVLANVITATTTESQKLPLAASVLETLLPSQKFDLTPQIISTTM